MQYLESATDDHMPIIQAFDFDYRQPQAVKGNIRDLTRQFRHVDPRSFGLLKRIGTVETHPSNSETRIQASQSSQFEFIFQIRDGLQLGSPKTSRDILLSQERISLTTRVKLAQQLARSVTQAASFTREFV